jgi:phenylalanyl-tRNA synthetase beta chain
LIDRLIEFSKIKKAVQALELAELREFRLIDLYQGQNLPEDKLSMTVRLKFADPSRTLTQDEVNDRSERVLSLLKAEFGVQPR